MKARKKRKKFKKKKDEIPDWARILIIAGMFAILYGWVKPTFFD